MKKNTTALMYFGMTLGLLVSYLSKTPIKLETVCFFGVVTILCVDGGKFFEGLRLLFITSIVIYYPCSWYMGKFHWWDIIFFTYLIVVLINSIFIVKKTKTIFVQEGDIISFPPVLIPDHLYPIDSTLDPEVENMLKDFMKRHPK